MAKRFYDSGMFDDPFFRKLSPEMKCAYYYLQCKCNYAGVLDIDIDDINFKIGCKNITLEDLKETFQDKFVILDENPNRLKIFIPKFILWQYKNELTPNNGVHRNVFAALEQEFINAEQFLAPKVWAEDFRTWSDLYPYLKSIGITYRDYIKER